MHWLEMMARSRPDQPTSPIAVGCVAVLALCCAGSACWVIFLGIQPTSKARALDDALVAQDIDRVVRLLKDGASVHTRCLDGSDITEYWRLPVHVAAESGNAPMLRVLLDSGADPNASNSQGYTPLMAIVNADNRSGHRDCIRLLLERGAKINQQRNEDGGTVLHLAYRYGDMAMANFLIEYGADPSIRDFQGRHVRDHAPPGGATMSGSSD
jgi:ankyrin repeat protein